MRSNVLFLFLISFVNSFIIRIFFFWQKKKPRTKTNKLHLPLASFLLTLGHGVITGIRSLAHSCCPSSVLKVKGKALLLLTHPFLYCVFVWMWVCGCLSVACVRPPEFAPHPVCYVALSRMTVAMTTLLSQSHGCHESANRWHGGGEIDCDESVPDVFLKGPHKGTLQG